MVSAEDAVIAWLRSRGFDSEVHTADYDLIENRVVDSLHFTEFIFLLEQFTNRQIPTEGLVLDRLRTLRAIRENFLADTGSGEMEEAAI